MKKKLRKDVAQEKMEKFKTGGGGYSGTYDSSQDLLLSIVNKKTIFGLNNPYDMDNIENVEVEYVNDDSEKASDEVRIYTLTLIQFY